MRRGIAMVATEYFGYLDAAVKMILDAGLAVEIDMHPDSDFKARLAKEDDFVERFADFWSMVAQHYASSSWDPDRVFFEILNEPEMRDAYRWYGVEAKLAAAIRRGAPANTIIAAGARWDDDDDLVFLEPLPDPNVIYVFHFYEPQFSRIRVRRGALITGNGEGAALSVVAGECGEGGEAGSRSARSHAGDSLRPGSLGCGAHRSGDQSGRRVGRSTGVPLICNEFGVFRDCVRSAGPRGVDHRRANCAGAPQHRLGDVGLFGQLRRALRTGEE